VGSEYGQVVTIFGVPPDVSGSILTIVISILKVDEAFSSETSVNCKTVSQPTR
jgi:hypothetical protein